MISLNSENFDDEVIKHKGLVLIDFSASWCGPCRMLAPILDELEGELLDVKFCKVDVDESRELAMKFRVESIPHLALVRDDVYLDLSVGYKSKLEIVDFINSNR